MTALYSVLHFLVDGVCAYAMLGRFRDGFLLYNFCAFALQLPLGAVLDRSRWRPGWFVWLGCGLTLLGAWTHPAVLGLGNALFHVGGGVEVIREDCTREKNGALLGVFVAPGALGLYAGGALRGQPLWFFAAAAVMAALALLPRKAYPEPTISPADGSGLWISLLCFAVVVLRSFVGMTVTFPWKTGALAFLATVMVAGGKVLGGLLAAWFGGKRIMVLSLLTAAAGFWLGDLPVFGLLALLCFNMTMPLTLYALWRRFPDLPGTAFGALTLGLFLGFVPVYFGVSLPIGGEIASIVSLVLLWTLF